MATIGQLGKNGRKHRRRRCKVPALVGCPQKRVLINKIAIMSPRKPNSAKRKFVKVTVLGRVSGIRAFAHIPGMGPHGLAKFGIVLMEGGSPPDVPGVNYSLIRGLLSFTWEERWGRVNRRSKFGCKQWKK